MTDHGVGEKKMTEEGRRKSPVYHHHLVVSEEAIDEHNHVSNVEYLRWMIDAATEHSNIVGCTRATTEAGAMWNVRSHQIEYLRPANAGDRIVVRTWIADFGKIRSPRRYEIVREDDDVMLARGETMWVYIDRSSGRPRPIPEEIMLMFEADLAE